MEESELLKLLKDVRGRLPNLYRHLVGLIKAVLETQSPRR